MLFKKKECIAMLLAGGQGSRLTVLTEETAKPAVPFGGKYRIIDFPLSNCVNSGIDTVGILTQYQPLQLNEYLGNGQPWGLNRLSGGAHVLSPYSKSSSSEWYSGTANAIYQNINFIDRYNPEHVLILSGDHIYQMDYAKMLTFHKDMEADCTIAVIDVPMSEASRFGIMDSDENGIIRSFEEKPKEPKSNHASMGIYIFKWDILRRFLTDDSNDPTSSNDFGKNIIPRMLADRHRLCAYRFKGYWKDVGTIRSLWEANMDILGDMPKLNLRLGGSRIYARNYAMPSSFIADGSSVKNSFVAEGSTVYGNVVHSVISTGCVIEAGVEIRDSVIMPNAVIEAGSVICHSIIGEDTHIGRCAVIGETPPKHLSGSITVVGKGRNVPENAHILPGESV